MVKENSWFDRRMSIGNLITIGIMLASLIAGWYQFKAELEMARVQISQEINDRSKLETRVVKIETERDDVRDRLTRIEVQMSEHGATLSRILQAVEGHDRPRN